MPLSNSNYKLRVLFCVISAYVKSVNMMKKPNFVIINNFHLKNINENQRHE